MTYYGQNTPDNTLGFIGNGNALAAFLDAKDKPVGGHFSFGQISSLSIELSTEKASMQDTMTGSKGTAQETVISTEATTNFTLNSFHKDVLRPALFAKLYEDAEDVGKTMKATVNLGRSIVVDGIIKEITSIVRDSDSADVTENFIISNGSIYTDKDQSGFAEALVEDDAVTITYTSLAVDRIEAFVESGINLQIVFDGFNIADENRPVKVTLHKVALSPSAARNLISTEYATHDITGTLLASKAVTGTGLSRLFKEEHVIAA
ncbi:MULTISPECIES: hypothetical protein [Vibrio]|uniref:phage tail tube protein n=1 Tax=Vibrio TaxID=662 RepID=UPI0004215B5D|nr:MULTISPECIES: hypothetical protein [Vibrio]MBH9742178.1 hypothetical protein [Vibrio navarrensis]